VSTSQEYRELQTRDEDSDVSILRIRLQLRSCHLKAEREKKSERSLCFIVQLINI